MNRYMRADFHRIFRRIPRYIALGILFVALAAIMLFLAKGRSVYEVVELLTKYVSFFMLLFGLVEFIFVFNDDFKAKTMQVAIGTGISRKRVVIGKWAEVTLLCVLDFLVAVVLIIVCCNVRGALFSGEPAGDVLILMLFSLLNIVGSVGLAMIVTFVTQNTTAGMMLYLLTALGITAAVGESLLEIGPLQSLNLGNCIFRRLLDVGKARLLIGTFSLPVFLGMAAWLFLFGFLAIKLFKKKELDF